jgi:GDP-D-mannose dehydratase
MRKALITGCTGQDGSYLAEFLLAKGRGGRAILPAAGF